MVSFIVYIITVPFFEELNNLQVLLWMNIRILMSGDSHIFVFFCLFFLLNISLSLP